MTSDNFDIGELFMIGFNETSFNDELKDYLKNFPFGSVILFGRNLISFDQWQKLTSSLQEFRANQGKPPYIIAVDEEGGTVSRMPDDNYTFPGARALAQTNDNTLVNDCARAVGKILNYTGTNLNLAPVLDVNVTPVNPGIGIRSFATNAKTVADCALNFIEGLRAEGIFACAKHFPGKGDIVKDSHKTLPVCTSSEKDLQDIHIAPFKTAIAQKVPFIMSSHAVYPNLSKDNMPATLSYEILTGLLREKLQFNGLIISDDLEMGAMRECGEIHQTAYKSIMAGCDMILICHDKNKQVSTYNFLNKKYRNDPEFKKRCDESFKRITELKKNLPKPHREFPHKTKELIKLSAQKSIKCIKTDSLDIPVAKSIQSGKILLAGAKFRSDIEVEMIGRTPYEITDFYNYLKKYFNNIDLSYWDINPGEKTIKNIANTCFDEYSLIILCANNAILYPGQEKIIELFMDKYAQKTILLAVKNPEDTHVAGNAKNIILTFGYNKANIEAAGDFITQGPSI